VTDAWWIGEGIKAELAARGDRALSPEIYITEDISICFGALGVYLYSKHAGRVYFLAATYRNRPAATRVAPVPTMVAYSENHGGYRKATKGIIIHSTRGNAESDYWEFVGALNWFRNPGSGVSAHAVISKDGVVAFVVDPDLVAWHAGEHNEEYLGVELVQRRPGDEITIEQYKALAWWCVAMAKRYGFELNEQTLIEHKDTPQGKREGKTDVGQPFSVRDLLEYIRRVGA